MHDHPLNLALRFVLEMAALAALAYWGWTQHHGTGRWVWAFGLVLGASIVWGTLRVNDDPRPAPVPVPGVVRLLIEAVFFGGAVTLLAAADRAQWAVVLGVVVVIHYLLSYERIRWLLKQ